MGNKMTGTSGDEESERQQKIEAWRRCLFAPLFTCAGILGMILMMVLVKMVALKFLLPVVAFPMFLVGLMRLLRNVQAGGIEVSCHAPSCSCCPSCFKLFSCCSLPSCSFFSCWRCDLSCCKFPCGSPAWVLPCIAACWPFASGTSALSSKAGKDVNSLTKALPMAIEYQHITAGQSTMGQVCNNVRFAGHHYSRYYSFAQLKMFRIFSDSEQTFLQKEFNYTHNLLEDSAAIPIVNYLAWRRSALLVLFVACIAIVGFEIQDLANLWGKYQDARTEKFVIDFDKWRLTTLETFPSCLADYELIPRTDDANYRTDTVISAKSCQEDCRNFAGCRFWQVVSRDNGEQECHLLDTSPAQSEPLKESPGSFAGSRDCNLDELPMIPSVDLSFTRFSKGYMNSLADRWAESVHKYDFIRQCVLLLSKFAVLGFVARALSTWGSWRRSGLMIRVAWMLAFLGPFAASCIPLRAVANVAELTGTMPTYSREALEYYKLEEKFQDLQGELLDLCRKKIPDAGDKVKEMKNRQEQICNKVRRIPEIKFLGVKPGPAKDMCDKAASMITQDDIDQSFKEMQHGCKKIQEAMVDISDDSGDMFDMLQGMLQYLGHALDAVIGAMNALVSSKKIVPAAMSVGPGLVKGALRAKNIVPEASIPGMFLILLPWLYAPLTWLICNLFVQFTGTVLVLFALMSFSFGPLVSGIIAWRLSANNPMTEKQMQRLTYWLAMWGKASLATTVIFLASYVVSFYIKWQDEIAQYSHRYKELVDRVAVSILAADIDVGSILLLVLSIVVNFFFKMSLTMVVTTDYMLQETAFQHQFEDLNAQMDTLPQHIQDCAQEIKIGRKRRLNALVMAIEGNDEGPGRVARFFDILSRV